MLDISAAVRVETALNAIVLAESVNDGANYDGVLNDEGFIQQMRGGVDVMLEQSGGVVADEQVVEYIQRKWKEHNINGI